MVGYLEDQKIWFRIIEKEATTHTADAAASTGMPLERIVKSLVCLNERGDAILVVVPGNCRVDLRRVAQVVECKSLRLFPFDKVETYSGYPAGATPPVCHVNVKMVIVDQQVMRHETVFGGGGTSRKLFEIKPKDIIRLNKAVVAEVAEAAK